MNPTDSTEPDRVLPRRRALGVGLAALWLATGAGAAPPPREPGAAAHFPFGPVSPRRPVPACPVRLQTGVATDLASLFVGHVSAVQLMFTGCSATCPIQGALFAQAQAELGDRLPTARFVSLSIDPLADSPAALAAWLRRFGARPGWLAGAPRIEDVERLIAWLGEGGETRPRGPDPHTGQVFLIDRRGQLAFRTASMPPTADIVAALQRVAAEP